MTVIRGFAAAAALTALLPGCATLVTPVDPFEPLAIAFREPVDDLQARAATGGNEAEYALSFLYRYGLRGLERDPSRYRALREGAQSATTLMLTQYIPAVGGGSGSVHPLPVRQPGMHPRAMELLDECGVALVLDDARAGQTACGPDAWNRLQPLARQAIADRAASTPLP